MQPDMQRDPYHGTEAQRRTEEEIVKFETGFESCYTRVSNVFGFDAKVDRGRPRRRMVRVGLCPVGSRSLWLSFPQREPQVGRFVSKPSLKSAPTLAAKVVMGRM